MSLSPFDSFQSRFVTYLLNFPRTFVAVQCMSLNSSYKGKYFRKKLVHKIKTHISRWITFFLKIVPFMR